MAITEWMIVEHKLREAIADAEHDRLSREAAQRRRPARAALADGLRAIATRLDNQGGRVADRRLAPAR